MNSSENIGFKVEGHVKIVSYDDDRSNPEVHLDKRNHIHKENMSIALARALGGDDSGHVYSIHFGTGGATVDSAGTITYSDPNVTGSADLNTPLYSEVVDPKRGAPAGNFTGVRHLNGSLFSDVEIRCVIDKGEPFGQPSSDNVSQTINGGYVFDEIALKTDDGLMLTHIVFNPIEKTANRVFEVVYTLRLRLI